MKTRTYTLKRTPEPEPRGLFDRAPVPSPAPAEPASAAPEDRRPNVQRIRLMALSAPHGWRYCFACDEFEGDVAIYLVGRRWMYLCAKEAAARGGKKWTGRHDKPTED